MKTSQLFTDQPAVLCKYRDWSNEYHRTILTERELYFSPPSCFEDETDCRNDISDFSKREREINFQELDKRCGILSMTKNQNNYALWEEYANHSQGFMVAFDGHLLCHMFSCCGDVSYYDKLPPIKYRKEQSVEEYIYHKYFAKLMKYEYEQEFRLIISDFQGLSKEKRKVKIPAEAYKYIKLGKNMTVEDVNALTTCLPAELSDIPIYI